MNQLGPYRLERELARGGMGTVYLARHALTGAVCALKTLQAIEGMEEELLARLQREAEALGRLDHPHVVRVHAADFETRPPYLIQDLLTGGSLAQRLRDGPLPPAEAAELVAKLADAMAHAHAAGVLHRDIKPDNVLFDDRDQPRLTDFGLAVVRGTSRLTREGEVLGTPSYMAPEQVEGGACDERTDVYGLGALLYATIAGQPPFQESSVLATLAAVCERPPTPPARLNPAVPRWLEDVCLRALAKSADDRFPSARALARALRTRDGGGARPGRLRGVAALLALLVVAAVAIGAALAPASPPAPRPAPPRPPRPRSARELAAERLATARAAWAEGRLPAEQAWVAGLSAARAGVAPEGRQLAAEALLQLWAPLPGPHEPPLPARTPALDGLPAPDRVELLPLTLLVEHRTKEAAEALRAMRRPDLAERAEPLGAWRAASEDTPGSLLAIAFYERLSGAWRAATEEVQRLSANSSADLPPVERLLRRELQEVTGQLLLTVLACSTGIKEKDRTSELMERVEQQLPELEPGGPAGPLLEVVTLASRSRRFAPFQVPVPRPPQLPARFRAVTLEILGNVDPDLRRAMAAHVEALSLLPWGLGWQVTGTAEIRQRICQILGRRWLELAWTKLERGEPAPQELEHATAVFEAGTQTADNDTPATEQAVALLLAGRYDEAIRRAQIQLSGMVERVIGAEVALCRGDPAAALEALGDLNKQNLTSKRRLADMPEPWLTRAHARALLGDPGWEEDLRHAEALLEERPPRYPIPWRKPPRARSVIEGQAWWPGLSRWGPLQAPSPPR